MPTPTATIFLPYSALDAVILRGARAAQPAASAVVPGTLYCVTDEGAPVERSNGTTWQVYSPTPGGSGTGTGDVVGPGVATDQAIALYDGTTGKLIQDSATTIPALTASIESSVTASVIPVDLATETTGTLPDAHLSANVQLKPIAATDLPAHATRHQPGGADALAVDAAAATGSLRTLGTGAQQAAPGNDARFGAPTAPLAHHTTHEPGGADPLTVDAVAATGSLRTLGPGATQAAPGNDARLTNARTPTAHAPTHSAGNSDPVTVTALAGYPGGTTTFLRADGTFAAPAAGAPAAHHATHETGGSDAIVALSGAVITSGTVADARLSANVPLLAASNVFTGVTQELGAGVRVRRPTGPVDHRLWDVNVWTDGQLYAHALNDAATVDEVVFPLILSRTGTLTLYGDVIEKNRATPLGHWTDYTPTLAANSGTAVATTNYACKYTLVGKTLTLAFYLGVTLSATPTLVTLALPAGLTAAGYSGMACLSSSGPALIQTAGGTVVNLYREVTGTTAWPTGAQFFIGTHTFPIT